MDPAPAVPLCPLCIMLWWGLAVSASAFASGSSCVSAHDHHKSKAIINPSLTSLLFDFCGGAQWCCSGSAIADVTDIDDAKRGAFICLIRPSLASCIKSSQKFCLNECRLQ